MKCAFLLPLPPSVNSYYKRGRKIDGTPNMRISEKGKKFRTKAIAAMLEQRVPSFGSRPVVVEVDLHLREQGGDIDNYNKGILDGITHARVWNDDDQVVRLVMNKRPKVKGGLVRVTIEHASDELIDELGQVIGERPRSWGRP